MPESDAEDDFGGDTEGRADGGRGDAEGDTETGTRTAGRTRRRGKALLDAIYTAAVEEAAAAQRGVSRWHVSLSHDGGIATAVVIAETA